MTTEDTSMVVVEPAATLTLANGTPAQRDPAKADPALYIDEHGKPTGLGWRKIGEALRKPMNAKNRAGRGGKRFDYITARQVQDRLDAVVGPGNWCTSFRVLDTEKAIVECTLTVFGVSKADVGFPNSPDDPEDEALKSGYSDALKRAGVAWGIGRFLYGET